MKKTISLLLAIALCLGLCDCGNKETYEETAPEPLTELEQQLVDYIIQIASEEFTDPATVRVMNIGDYQERSKNEVDSFDYGPDTIVVKLTGISIDTGTSNPHYRICLTTTKNNSNHAQQQVKSYNIQAAIESLSGGNPDIINDANDSIMEYEGEAGEYVELSEYYTIETTSNNFDIKKINTAIAEHWEDLGM